MLGRVIALGLAIALGGGCDCEPKRASENLELPAGFEKVMQEHGALSVVARNALIRGELPLAQQSMRKLAFFMEHVPFPRKARSTRELPGSSPQRYERPLTWKRHPWPSHGSRTPAGNATTRSIVGRR